MIGLPGFRGNVPTNVETRLGQRRRLMIKLPVLPVPPFSGALRQSWCRRFRITI